MAAWWWGRILLGWARFFAALRMTREFVELRRKNGERGGTDPRRVGYMLLEDEQAELGWRVVGS